MKKNLKSVLIKVTILISISILIVSLFSIVLASEDSNFKVDQFDNPPEETKLNTLVANSGETTVAVLRIASAAISIIVLLVIAMKYMISAPGDRADIKKHAITYVVGTFILFAAAQIIAALIDIADKTLPTENAE